MKNHTNFTQRPCPKTTDHVQRDGLGNPAYTADDQWGTPD